MTVTRGCCHHPPSHAPQQAQCDGLAWTPANPAASRSSPGWERGPGTLQRPPGMAAWGHGNVPRPGPSAAGMGLAPLGPRSVATLLIGMLGSPAHGWPTDKARVVPNDCARRQPAGWEPPSPGDTAGRVQRARRAGGLLQGCETLGPHGSPSLGRGRLPGSPESTARVAQGADPLAEQYPPSNPPLPGGEQALCQCKIPPSALQTHRAASRARGEAGARIPPCLSFPIC